MVERKSHLAAKNVDVQDMNNIIQNRIADEAITYKSIDSVTNENEAVNFPIEFLNSLDVPGLPPHILTLKITAPIILLRNINQAKLCNGTRLVVKKLTNNLIEATILIGPHKDEDVLLVTNTTHSKRHGI